MSVPVKKNGLKNKYRGFWGYKMYVIVLTITIYIFFISTLMWNKDSSKFDNHIFLLKENQTFTHSVSDKFLSFGLDSSLLRNMNNLPINNEKFINLARLLSPAYVRIGGTAADCLFFNELLTRNELLESINSNSTMVDGNDISNFTLTGNDFVSLYEFTKKANIKMMFDLNTLLRNTDGSWNSDNARKIILFAKGHGMEIDWQMGNEPNSFFHVFKVKVSANQLAKDYCKLRSILNELGYVESILVGPEANHIGDEKHQGAVYAENFLSNVEDCIDYVTWHQYYLNGHIAQLKDFINSTVFNSLSEEIDRIKTAIKSSGKNISMWISETSSAYGGGAPELSDRYVAGFLWLDKLGYSAKADVQVVIRQSLFGGNYAMVHSDVQPNPDWWVAVIFKQFVSQKVLNLIAPNNSENIRVYAHCATKNVIMNKFTPVVIYGMNLNKVETKIYLKVPTEKTKALLYILTSDNLQSKNIFMNGEILKLQDDGNLPNFKPKVTELNQPIEVPPYSMFFILIQDMNISECLQV